MMAGGLALTLYGRPCCHLCEEMLAALQPLRAEFGFGLAVVDVDGDPQLQARHGVWVPVLMHGERELCHYHLDVAVVTDYLRDFR